MTQWQPIETAPKDGTPFLVWDGSELGVGTVEQKAYEDMAFLSERSAWIGYRDGPANIYLGGKDLLEAATHWMPLPDPPNA